MNPGSLLLSRAFFAGLMLCAASAHADDDATSPQGSESVVSRFEYTPREGQPGLGELMIELRDPATRQPLDYSGNRLAAWLQRSPKTLSDGEIGCVDKVRALASMGIGRRAAVDFNTYGLVTVNSDRTVAFINPFLRLNNAKLEAVLVLPGDATAVLHHPRAHELWVAMRESDLVAVIDTDSHAFKRQISFAPGSRPQALALAGDAVWIAFAGRNRWVRFDRSSSEQPESGLDAPATSLLLASPDGRHLLGLHAGGATVFEGGSARPRNVAMPAPAAAALWSELAQRWLVAAGDSKLRWIDPAAAGDMASNELAIDAPADRLVAFDGGRHALASMPSRGLVAVVDIASPRLLQSASVVPGATELALSEGFAYVHSTARATASLLSLADARKGVARSVHVAMGVARSAPDAEEPPTLGVLTGTPDGTNMLVANTLDGQIYQYAEGMMAPIGSFSNYKRSALALRVLNHGFESLGAGRYRASVRHTLGGAHELVVSGVQPRFANCLKLALPEVPDAKRAALAALPQATLLHAKAGPDGEGYLVDVRLDDKTAGKPIVAVSDLVLLAFDKHRGWQRRAHFVETAPGRYRATLDATPPLGRVELLVSSASQDLPFSAGRVGAIERSAP
ncbi:MAG: hypothetical protein ABIQ60_00915 [Burkholderiaceae bacterium]